MGTGWCHVGANICHVRISVSFNFSMAGKTGMGLAPLSMHEQKM
jgi:hypothetical protein